ncbi:Uncharacterised protein [Acinetobacter baumannii]|nr:Uncharacterised protein [Acinetobacter baumannii]
MISMLMKKTAQSMRVMRNWRPANSGLILPLAAGAASFR